jgi:hypothetical protein
LPPICRSSTNGCSSSGRCGTQVARPAPRRAVVWYAAALGVGFAIEARLGQIQRQGWEFYVAMASLFLTLAFPASSGAT